MKNCLKTKLKGVVNDNNLRKLGEWIIPVVKLGTVSYPSNQQSISVAFNASVETPVLITVDGDGYFATSLEGLTPEDGLTELLITDDSQKALYFANENYNIHISNKYLVTRFLINGQNASNRSIIVPNLDELEYSPLTQIRFNYVNGTLNLASLSKNTTMLNIEGVASGITGDLDNLSTLTTLQYITLNSVPIVGNLSSLSALTGVKDLWIKNTDIEGNISSLTMPNLRNLQLENTRVSGNVSGLASHADKLTIVLLHNTNISGDVAGIGALKVCTYIVLDNTSVEGTLESMASSAATYRNSGTMKVDAKNTGVTYQGNAFVRATITFTGSGQYTVALS